MIVDVLKTLRLMYNLFIRFIAVTALLVLGGCALAPGFYVGKGTAGRSLLGPRVDAADAPPQGGLTSITPELLRQQRANQPSDIPAAVKQLFGTPAPYVIGSGDVLSIVVWGHPELQLSAGGSGGAAGAASSGYSVSLDGLIQFPYVGTIKLAGLTEFEARDRLTGPLAEYIKDPKITVQVQAYRSSGVYVDGEVRTTGRQPIGDIPLTLTELIGRAGGFTAAADRAVIAITRAGQTTVVNLPELIAKGVDPSRVLLRNGDLVRVLGREDAKVYVLGEVLRSSTQTLRNGRLTLNEALSEAGGINPNSADPGQIFVVRTTKPDVPEIFHLDAKSPLAFALAAGFELQVNDVIYVDPVPLVRWNRVISLILPSAAAVSTTRVLSGN